MAVEPLPHKDAEIIAKSELEEKIAKKLRWDGYVFQYPAYYARIVKSVPVLNEKGKWVKVQAEHYTKVEVIPDIAPFNLNCNSKTFRNRVKQAMLALNLPKDFQKQFPYLYHVLKDQVMGKIIEQSKGAYYQRLAHLYREMTQQLLTAMVEIFQMITTRMLVEVPELHAYFERHPEDMALLQFTQQMIAPFVDPQLSKFDKFLLL